jgi:hypothetical protein
VLKKPDTYEPPAIKKTLKQPVPKQQISSRRFELSEKEFNTGTVNNQVENHDGQLNRLDQLINNVNELTNDMNAFATGEAPGTLSDSFLQEFKQASAASNQHNHIPNQLDYTEDDE